MKYKSIQWGLVVTCGPTDRYTHRDRRTVDGHTDRQTDRPDEANSYFRNFAKAPNLSLRFNLIKYNKIR